MSILLLSLLGCTHDFGLNQGWDEGELPRDSAAAEEEPVDSAEDSVAPEDSEHLEDLEPTEDDPPEQDLPPEDDCRHTSDLIYVLSRGDGRLMTFDPVTAEFTSLGTPRCGSTQTPGSMAVSRDGVAYVRYADDSVFAVYLDTMACTPTSYSDRRTHFDSFGMGYSTDSADTWRDQLYVANGSTLGVLDTATWTLTPIGDMPSQSELTGNAEGELWAMLPLERVAELARLDKSNGQRVERLSLPDFPDPAGIDTFAFATWNGRFYLFIREYGMGSSTDVYEVTRAGVMRRVLSDVGFDVVGAGVSTCAPG